jgi:hypothetical protein
MRLSRSNRVTRSYSALLVIALTTFPTALVAEDLVLDWVDEARDPEFARGAVFLRNLVCWTPNQGDACELTVITVGRNDCPVHLSASSYRTIDGSLAVSRSDSTVDLEFDGVSLAGPTHWTLHLGVRRPAGALPFVERASGVVVTKPVLPGGDPIRSTALRGFVKETKGLDIREWVEIELKCPRVAAVAAKRDLR